MKASRIALVLAAVSALALAGCQSERFSSLNTQPVAAAPAPLSAAPVGQIQSSQLPPPSAPGTVAQSDFPVAPGTEAGTQMAALPPQGGPDISAGSVAGVWNATVAGQGCRVATPQTRFGEGFRAGPLRCPAPLDGVKSWNVSGSQLTLYGDGGSALASLSSTGEGRFDGQTSTGQPVSLSR